MATITEVKICNMALRELHAAPILNLTEGSPEADVCDLYYEVARNTALAAAPWNFAIQRTGIQATITAPQWEYALAYSYPSNCLRLLEINGKVSGWRVETDDDGGKIITTDLADIQLKYIREVTDPQQFSAGFVVTLSKLIKHFIAVPITGQKELADAALQEYQGFLGQAKTDSGQESSQVLYKSGALTDVRR